MHRRSFLAAGMGAAALSSLTRSLADVERGRLALGFDNFSIRAWGWKAPKLLEFAAEQRCDAVLFSDLDVFESHDASHLAEIREQAAELGVVVHAGTGGICPSSTSFKDKWGSAEEHLRLLIRVASGLGTPVARCYLGNGRDRASEGGIRARIADTVKVLKSVKGEALDAGVKFAVENHAGDMQAHELRDLIEEAGTDFVGATVDAGNATWTLEDPVVNLEVLAPYALSAGIRDSMVWETETGARAQWTAMGEGNVDFESYFKVYAERCPQVPVILEIISEYGKDLPYWKREFWKAFPEARASEFARFQELAKTGRAVPGFQPTGDREKATREFQMEQLRKSLAFCRDSFGIGRRA